MRFHECCCCCYKPVANNLSIICHKNAVLALLSPQVTYNTIGIGSGGSSNCRRSIISTNILFILQFAIREAEISFSNNNIKKYWNFHFTIIAAVKFSWKALKFSSNIFPAAQRKTNDKSRSNSFAK